MSVLIKGMEMPKKCDKCKISLFCLAASKPAIPMQIWMKTRPDWCPLIEVPEPHGRLGDLDELHNHLNEWYLTHEHGFSETEKIYIRAMLSGVKDSPTVIPANEEDKT